ncbi:Histidinol-phosphate aminotransferase [subsurface metagenome]
MRVLPADYAKAPKEHIILAPGSDLLLREVVHSFSGGRKIIMVSPSFFPTVQAAKQFATKLISIRLNPPEFKLPLGALIDELKEPSLVIIDNPNNPTGKTLLDRRMIQTMLSVPETLIVIDEAYYEFSRITFADLVQEYSNLAITRTGSWCCLHITMDKAFSLAGARIGYAISGETFRDVLSVFYAFLPRSSYYAAVEALKNPDYARKNIDRLLKERERVQKSLDQLGVDVYVSSTNFLLVKAEVPDMARRLEEANVLVSDLSNQLPAGFIRISIGSKKENDALIDRYKKIFSAIK